MPIIPDEARTFGMEGLFRQLGIYASKGQLYEPVDHDQIMFYREDQKGQILQEGINEAGAMSSFIAAGTAYANYGINMIPFYVFYSMFGFQRVGDLIWAAADIQARAFCSARPRPHDARPAKGCSTATVTAMCWPARCRAAWPTTRRTPTSSR